MPDILSFLHEKFAIIEKIREEAKRPARQAKKRGRVVTRPKVWEETSKKCRQPVVRKATACCTAH
jgi:hypothetical protein